MKIFFEIKDNTKLINMVQENDNGTRTEKLITIEDCMACFTSSIERRDSKKEVVKTALFRELKGCRLIQSKTIGAKNTKYILISKKRRMPMQLFNRFYDNVGIPNLIYCIHVVNNRLSRIFVAATKEDDIKSTTQIYKYPFTNVSDSTDLACIGRNNFLPGIEDNDLQKLYDVPNQFMSMPNNLDYYRATNNSKCYECEELIKSLVEKDFDDDLLVEKGITYQEWFNRI